MLKSWLRRYLELHPPAASDTQGYEWAFTNLQPLLVSGKPLVSAEGLHRWIRLVEPLERRELTLALKRSGAESRELFRRIQGRGLKRWYWSVGHLVEWEDTPSEG
jgi:hypothetical protein